MNKLKYAGKLIFDTSLEKCACIVLPLMGVGYCIQAYKGYKLKFIKLKWKIFINRKKTFHVVYFKDTFFSINYYGSIDLMYHYFVEFTKS